MKKSLLFLSMVNVVAVAGVALSNLSLASLYDTDREERMIIDSAENTSDGDAKVFVGKPWLSGFVSLPADSFAEGPASGGDDGEGNPISSNGRVGPFPGQPIQGFSAVQRGSLHPHHFLFLSDNGFGAKENSSDYLLRLYETTVNFSWFDPGKISVEDYVSFSDPNHYVPFPITLEDGSERLLTGSDFDIESLVVDNNGDLWIGDEFGPFLLHFSKTGELLEAPIATPEIRNGQIDLSRQVMSPQNPFLSGEATLPRSRGFEGMAFSPARDYLYPLLEGTVKGDPENSLRIYKVSTQTSEFVDFIGFYPTTNGNAIGDFTTINDHQFLVIERDGGQGSSAEFKKIFLIDFRHVDTEGFIQKTELVDLLNINDPLDVNNDGEKTFTFPFVTIENLLVLDPFTLLVANDNNYPFSVGRGPDIDNNEIIKISLPRPLLLSPKLWFKK
ncbi:esterase-like activity of phytase family protein [Marinibactrum halimedae]|uniref:Glycosyl transferase family 1 n=1 Tax=Marinibactrum halimedae TaxID=1444977 RepID=A0AA37WNK1_9GAMM|nr:esterase-like activity of phytase family protein [Marinibactrum halimedae]MCD9457632.1 esterase-like activity of phytase family protein [Marinibactrum halimedae]GLS28054.1 glycosyl transferase family 1 [Marinibactrum halimedae]